ncbi:MAG: GvpL/GvpF family gas vesicle protein [Gemmatimonadetes bacterium]|nr:GvpL/GvpF family gas vesicle protein [Gemmatimonadota bacterium]
MADRRSSPRAPGPDEPGLRLLGIVHSERRLGPIWEASRAARFDAEVVRFRDVAALVYPGPVESASADMQEIVGHHRRLDALLQRETVVPAPYGVVFRTRRDVTRFLRERYGELGDALVFVEGRWEFRLHLVPEDREFPDALALDMATHIYAELRKLAHAAVPFPRDEPRTFTSAYLVDRMGTRAFLERVEELGRTNPDLALDSTGPWPPYDFVSMRRDSSES